MAASVENGEGVEALLTSMRAKAEEERREIRAEAEARVRAIQSEADGEIAALKQAAERELAAWSKARVERLRGEALASTRAELLKVRHEALNGAFDRARAHLLERTKRPEFSQALESLLVEALGEAGKPGEAEVSDADLPAAREILSRRVPHCRIVASKSGPGTVIIRSADGRRTIDNSLVTRLATVAALGSAPVAAILFEGSSP